MSFLGLIARFFLVLSDVPFFGCTTVKLSIYLLEDILVASEFWQYKAAINFVQVFVWT